MNKGSLLSFTLRLYGKSVVVGLLAFIMNSVLLAAYESQLLNVITLGLCYVLEGVVIYGEAWNQGFSDINRDKNENKTPDMMKGLKAGLVASIPIAIITLILILVKLSLLSEGFIAFYRIFNTVFQPLCLSLLPSTLTGAEIPVMNYLIISLTVFVIPFFSAPAYYLGYNDFSVSADMLYLKKK